MSVIRGYSGDKAGQGYGRQLPKRLHCPRCGKKGVKQPYPHNGKLIRECQYCNTTWTQFMWDVDATAAALDMRTLGVKKARAAIAKATGGAA